MEIKIKNISHMFFEFWEKSQKMEFGQQKILWKELYEEPNKEIFEHLEYIFKLSNKDCNIKDDLEKCFGLYSNFYDNMKFINYTITEDINKICKICCKIYKISDLKLNFIIMVGLFKSNAFVTPYNDTTSFYFLEQMSNKKYLNIVLAHEITHLFEFSQIISEDKDSLGSTIFTEGLACFASSCICPEFTLSEYICMEYGWEHWISDCNKQFNNIKSDIIDNLESTDYLYHIKYFVKNNSINNDIPTRIGYLIGYYVIEYLNKKYSMGEMIIWQQDRIIKEVKNVIGQVL